MYTRQEASRLRESFWATFGQYMAPLPSAEGTKINWINYKTGEPQIAFRMEAGSSHAFIGIVLSHPDPGIRHLYFEQFLQLKHLLRDALQEEWTWEQEHAGAHGKPESGIYTELPSVSVFRQDDWPALISFFKPRIMALDAFWSTAKYAFEALR